MNPRPHKNHPDYKAGIRFYTENVVNCPICGRQTNCAYQSQYGGRPAITCSREHADLFVGTPMED